LWSEFLNKIKYNIIIIIIIIVNVCSVLSAGNVDDNGDTSGGSEETYGS
jgi:hypothetical protein